MIGIRIEGRLGNQMFQYAYGLVLYKKLRQILFIDSLFVNFTPSKYFRLNRYSRFFNALKQKYFNAFELKRALKYTESADLNIQILNFKFYSYFTGSFQSLSYFKDYQIIICKEFIIKRIWEKHFESKCNHLIGNNKIIAIHFRKGDYVNYGYLEGGPHDISRPDRYIFKCLDLITDLEQYLMFFISDNIAYCREHFALIKNVFFKTKNEIVDMQMLINADICILSNSSFSWWGAYLNQKPGEIIYAPKSRRGHNEKVENPLGIIGDLNWNWIEL